MNSALAGGSTKIQNSRHGDGTVSTKSPKRVEIEHTVDDEPQRAAIVERKLAQLRGAR